MDPLFIGLLTAGIGLARDVLSYVLVPKSLPVQQSLDQPASTISKRKTVIREREIVREHTIVREKVLDKKALLRIINDTTQQFSKLLDRHTAEVISEMRYQTIKQAVHEVQARVSSLKLIINTNTNDSQIATQLVISALNPLQVSLEVARFRLQDHGEKEVWQFCHITGTSALVSGYSFLKHDVSYMVEELQSSMYEVQKQILNDVAAKIILSGRELPWEQVPTLLSPEGVDNLLKMYRSVVKEQNPTRKLLGTKVSAASHDVSTMTISEIRTAVLKIGDPKVLDAMLSQERKGKYRDGAIVAIRSRLKELST